MLGHHDVADDIESVAATGFLQRMLEDSFRFFRLKIRLTTITTEGDKVKVVGLLKSDESLGHGWRVAHSSFFCLSGAFCWCRRNTPSKQTMPGRGATLKSYCGTSASHLPRPQPRPSHQLATQKTNNSDQSRREQDHATGFGNRSDGSVEVGSVE